MRKTLRALTISVLAALPVLAVAAPALAKGILRN